MVIPVHDDNPTRRPAVVTVALIAVNVVVFLLSPLASHVVGDSELRQQCRAVAFFDQYGAKPDELLHNRAEPLVSTGEVGGQPGRAGGVEGVPTYKKVPVF